VYISWTVKCLIRFQLFLIVVMHFKWDIIILKHTIYGLLPYSAENIYLKSA